VKVLLLRHASAGGRLPSPAEDRARSLDRSGRAVAKRLPAVLAAYEIDRIVTSPHARCLETVAPLAQSLGLELECREALAPDASRRDTMRLLAELPETALVCTHREVVERLFESEVTCEKGAAWLLERRGRRLVPVSYLEPPARVIRQPRRRAAVRG
jgi:phosphohistidine phosphatase SixA